MVEKIRDAATALGEQHRIGFEAVLQFYLTQVARAVGVSRDTAERAKKEILSASGS